MNTITINTPKCVQTKQTNTQRIKRNSDGTPVSRTNNTRPTVVFPAPKLRQTAGLKNAWDDFTKRAKEAYGNMPISEIIDLAMTEENIIGEGSAKIVYKIPDIDDYVIGREKRIPYCKQDFIKNNIPFEKYNFGQPIAQNNSGVIIMKRVNGKPHSLTDWSDKVDCFLFNGTVKKTDAKKFLKGMKEISKMPLSAYIGFANQIKYLSDNGHRLDILSPNNALIDLKNKQINLIDLLDGQERFADFEGDLNTLYDMQSILCGTILHEASREQLSASEAKELDKATNETLKKCEIAGKYAGLSDDISNTINFYSIMDGFVSGFLGCEPKFLKTYQKFADRYQDYIPY